VAEAGAVALALAEAEAEADGLTTIALLVLAEAADVVLRATMDVVVDWTLVTALPLDGLAREMEAGLLEDAAAADVDSAELGAAEEPDAGLLPPASAALEHVLPEHF